MPVLDPRRTSFTTYAVVFMAAAYFIAAALTILFVGSLLRRDAIKEAESKARIILNHNLAIHTYHTHQLKPHLFELVDPAVSFDPVLMSSTFAVRMIHGYFSDLLPEGYYYKECAINARNRDNEADEFEADFLRRLNAGADSVADYSGVREIGGENYYVYMTRGETMETSCLKCHDTPEIAPEELITSYGAQRSFHRQPGEVISAVSIRVPLAVALGRANILSLELALGYVIIFGILFILHNRAGGILLRKPLQRVIESSLRISGNPEMFGNSIEAPKGRELAQLTDTLNTMSRNLADYRDNMQSKVDEQTQDILQANLELRKALDEVKTLRGIIPICSYCKKIRTDPQSWEQLESYISRHSDALFSHSICPVCMKDKFPDFPPADNKT